MSSPFDGQDALLFNTLQQQSQEMFGQQQQRRPQVQLVDAERLQIIEKFTEAAFNALPSHEKHPDRARTLAAKLEGHLLSKSQNRDEYFALVEQQLNALYRSPLSPKVRESDQSLDLPQLPIEPEPSLVNLTDLEKQGVVDALKAMRPVYTKIDQVTAILLRLGGEGQAENVQKLNSIKQLIFNQLEGLARDEFHFLPDQLHNVYTMLVKYVQFADTLLKSTQQATSPLMQTNSPRLAAAQTSAQIASPNMGQGSPNLGPNIPTNNNMARPVQANNFVTQMHQMQGMYRAVTSKMDHLRQIVPQTTEQQLQIQNTLAILTQKSQMLQQHAFGLQMQMRSLQGIPQNRVRPQGLSQAQLNQLNRAQLNQAQMNQLNQAQLNQAQLNQLSGLGQLSQAQLNQLQLNQAQLNQAQLNQLGNGLTGQLGNQQLGNQQLGNQQLGNGLTGNGLNGQQLGNGLTGNGLNGQQLGNGLTGNGLTAQQMLQLQQQRQMSLNGNGLNGSNDLQMMQLMMNEQQNQLNQQRLLAQQNQFAMMQQAQVDQPNAGSPESGPSAKSSPKKPKKKTKKMSSPTKSSSSVESPVVEPSQVSPPPSYEPRALGMQQLDRGLLQQQQNMYLQQQMVMAGMNGGMLNVPLNMQSMAQNSELNTQIQNWNSDVFAQTQEQVDPVNEDESLAMFFDLDYESPPGSPLKKSNLPLVETEPLKSESPASVKLERSPLVEQKQERPPSVEPSAKRERSPEVHEPKPESKRVTLDPLQQEEEEEEEPVVQRPTRQTRSKATKKQSKVVDPFQGLTTLLDEAEALAKHFKLEFELKEEETDAEAFLSDEAESQDGVVVSFTSSEGLKCSLRVASKADYETYLCSRKPSLDSGLGDFELEDDRLDEVAIDEILEMVQELLEQENATMADLIKLVVSQASSSI